MKVVIARYFVLLYVFANCTTASEWKVCFYLLKYQIWSFVSLVVDSSIDNRTDLDMDK